MKQTPYVAIKAPSDLAAEHNELLRPLSQCMAVLLRSAVRAQAGAVYVYMSVAHGCSCPVRVRCNTNLHTRRAHATGRVLHMSALSSSDNLGSPSRSACMPPFDTRSVAHPRALCCAAWSKHRGRQRLCLFGVWVASRCGVARFGNSRAQGLRTAL